MMTLLYKDRAGFDWWQAPNPDVETSWKIGFGAGLATPRMITRGEEYVEQGMEIYEQRRLNRTFAHLDRRTKQLGYQLV